MTKIIGRQINIGIGKEIVRGTAVAPDYWVQYIDADVETKVELVQNESSVGRIEDTDGAEVVSKWGEGTISGKVKDESMGIFLNSCFGDVSSAEVETGVYDHTFAISQDTQHQSVTVAVKDPNIDEAFPNCVIDSVKIDGELGNFLMFEAAFMGKAAESASNTPSYSVERDFVPQMLEFKHAATQAGLDGASAVAIRNFSIEMRSNIMREDVLGVADGSPNDVINQSFAIEGTITLIHDGTTFEDLQNNSTDQAIRLKATHTETIGAASKPTLTIDLYKSKIFDYERSISQNDLVEETFSFKANYSIADGFMSAVTLRNEVASY